MFHSGAAIVPFVAAAVLFYGLYHVASAIFLLMHRFSRLARWWVAGAIFSVAGNLLLVPHLSRAGAAFTQTMTFGVIGIGALLGAQRLYRLELDVGRVSAVLAGVLAAGFAMSPAWSNDPISSLLLKFPIGLIAAFLVVWLLAPGILPWAKQELVVRFRGG
jgi:O-antigen/teichoic acid export membrane protein